MKLITILTSFNRKPLTLACLQALHAAAEVAAVDLHIVLVDDASTDGTAAAVNQAYPGATVIAGDGSLFWNRGMHLGMKYAMGLDADYLLWLNDDTQLRPEALQRLLREAAALRATTGKPVIMVGATTGPDGKLSYGGAVAPSPWRRFTYRKVWNERQPVPCHVMNGNCVLLPLALVHVVGNLDPAYEHAMGDTDYALRAARAGFALFVGSGLAGECANNPVQGTFTDARMPLTLRWRAAMHRKGLPWRSWLHFTRRHGGFLWPVYFTWPYLRIVLSSAIHKAGA